LQQLPKLGLAEESLRIVEHHLDTRLGLFARVSRWFARNRNFERAAELIENLSSQMPVMGQPAEDIVAGETLEYWQEWLKRLMSLLEVARLVHGYRRTFAALKQLLTPEQFAADLADLEERLWDWGAGLIAATGRLLPDRLTGNVRRALGEFRATVERLAHDEVGGKAYARLRRDQERLFGAVSSVLPVWCVTNLAARGTLPFDAALFDLVVIDEASQCDFPSALPLLFRARRAMIIGDPNQLRHVKSLPRHRDQQIQARYDLIGAEDAPYFFENSLYDVTATSAGETVIIALREHFRSHADIISFSNRQWYRSTLRVCTDYRRLTYPPQSSPGIQWTSVRGKVLSPSGGWALNHQEAVAVVNELVSLLSDRRFGGTVGVVTPFRAQANRMRDLANERLDLSLIERSELVIDTAHGFQGDERDVIIFSPCVAPEMPRGAQWFLAATGNLFNVSITRARSLLHVIGDRDACSSCGIKHIEEFAKYVASLERGKRPSRQRVEFGGPEVGYWERPFYEALVDAGLKPIPQYVENQYRLDLAVIEGDIRIDIEIDGELYHKEWDGTRCRRDVIRDLRVTALGWVVKRFWVYRIRDEMSACVEEVLALLESLRSRQART
jgi:very-short-patch-repair endonuclease